MSDFFSVEIVEQVGSTNDELKKCAREGAPEGLCITAIEQTAGKGRVGRVWESVAGNSLTTSCLLRPKDIPMNCIPTITLVCGMAVKKFLEREFGIISQIKWPNDIVVDGKKLCGILVEMEAISNEVNFIVSGIGLNIHQKDFSEEIAYKSTSIDLELKHMYPDESLDTIYEKCLSESCRAYFLSGISAASKLEYLSKKLWDSFKEYYDIFMKTCDMTYLREEYEDGLVNMNQSIKIEAGKDSYEAIARGINNRGALLVEVADSIQEIDSGEVSVRGIYGYV